MRSPNRFLTALVTAALVMVQFPLGGRALKAAQAPDSLGSLGGRFLNGGGAAAVSRQEPVPLAVTQIPGFFGAGNPLRVGTTPEPWDLDPLTGAEPQVEPLPLLAEPPQVLAQANSQSDVNRLYQQGLEQFRRSQFREAISSWEQVLEIVRAAGNRQGEGTVLNALGAAYENLSQYERAIGFYEEALEIAREIGARVEEGNALGNLGNAYNELGQYERAIDLYEQSLAIDREIGNRAGESSVLGNLGVAYSRLGQYERAIDLYGQRLELAREIGDRAGEGIALGNLGNVYFKLGQYERAIDLHEQRLAIAREIGNRAGEGAALGGLGLAYSNLGQYERAIDFYEQDLAIAREIGDRAGEGRVLVNLGSAYRNLGQDDRAISLYEQALALFREIGNRAGEGHALGGLGNVYFSLGQYERAIDFHEQDLAIAREIGDRAGEGRALNNLGNVYNNLGQYERAIGFYEQQLAITREIGDRAGEGRALGNLGVAYRSLGQDERALEQYGQAVALFNELGARAEEALFLSNIGIILNDRDQPELAIIFLKASVDIREAIRGDIRGLDTDLQQSFTDTISDDYRLLADLLLQQNRIIEAQRVLDLLKVQELDDYLQDVRRNGRTEGGVDYLRPELTILARYSDLQDSAIEAGRELASLRAIPSADRTAAQTQRIATLDALLREINSDFRDFARSPEIRDLIEQLSFEARDASLDLADLNRLRDELQQLNAVIFYPLVLEDRLELIITTPDAPPLRRTVPISREELNRTILSFRDALETQDPDVTTPAQQLYDWLIAPLQADLEAAGVDTIIYAPDGQLRYIPLAALHDGDQWLAQRYQVNNITAESLTDFTEADTAQPTILAAAYTDDAPVHTPLVNGTTYTFTGLPGARDEVALLPSSRLLLDGDFSLAALLPIMTDYSVLHLATHAAFVPGVPEDSFILFGNGDTPTLRDIEDWTLNGVDLVVLSACETGVGGLGNGEEILGLGYQFQVSGAKAVMASLWTVSDRGTQALMAEFYTALSDPANTKAAALQAAQVALITGEAVTGPDGQRAGARPTTEGGRSVGSAAFPGYSHPYYWAPFILIGNGL
jgi:CHAT domain-containing protein/tetratricopeptide (TPR) repeat protein